MTIRGGGNPHPAMAAMPLREWTRRLGASPAEAYDCFMVWTPYGFNRTSEHQLSHADEMKGMSRENALAEFIKYQLRPLAARGELSRHFRIFDWEAVRPTARLPEIGERRSNAIPEVSPST